MCILKIIVSELEGYTLSGAVRIQDPLRPDVVSYIAAHGGLLTEKIQGQLRLPLSVFFDSIHDITNDKSHGRCHSEKAGIGC